MTFCFGLTQNRYMEAKAILKQSLKKIISYVRELKKIIG